MQVVIGELDCKYYKYCCARAARARLSRLLPFYPVGRVGSSDRGFRPGTRTSKGCWPDAGQERKRGGALWEKIQKQTDGRGACVFAV